MVNGTVLAWEMRQSWHGELDSFNREKKIDFAWKMEQL